MDLSIWSAYIDSFVLRYFFGFFDQFPFNFWRGGKLEKKLSLDTDQFSANIVLDIVICCLVF